MYILDGKIGVPDMVGTDTDRPTERAKYNVNTSYAI
jgi:hypothetical protein